MKNFIKYNYSQNYINNYRKKIKIQQELQKKHLVKLLVEIKYSKEFHYLYLTAYFGKQFLNKKIVM